MQFDIADNRDPSSSDDIELVMLDDSDELDFDFLQIPNKAKTSPADLLARRRRAEDMLEARRLREELGDEDFSF
ncbi:hypothetical protein E0F26_03735 [Candidatus Paraluminiphilus aquimaris]|jgi:hypothetical protein|uniref:Uncharacterized protein n=1 Tax=Candidatus Paraluminiphilus aquimaris TaxID=2518994 RepID=A0ABY6Q3R9_9GAMM|nr:hypothetical protein [Candidatus Paraluminiphilus aquimaris]UZP73909.1 hypothetical protein E0F26_03735 [Candidatus Paraluminiphilus aquimaris]